jgi:hypothetical protein
VNLEIGTWKRDSDLYWAKESGAGGGGGEMRNEVDTRVYVQVF